ncbi:MAG: 3-deoxy-D-manno-octulosonic acid transferase [Alphaproteobacteria bacterium]|nr:3-deoxy-D-manno-octulosonic acid transferase [Alphaproteobacteria bacterium]
MTRGLYSGLAALAEPALRALLARRVAAGKEDALRLPERRGVAGRPRPSGKLLWVHGASLGEARSVLPLVRRILAVRPGLRILVTTGSRTSAEMLARELDGKRAFHQFVPLDVPRWVERFLNHWRPDAVLWLESELWPNMLGEIARRRIPAALVNARLTARSARRWMRVRAIFAPPLETFSIALAQTSADAARIASLGHANVMTIGNLKHDAPPLGVEVAALDAFQAAVAGRPRWLAAQVHPLELAAVLDAAARLKAAGSPSLLVLVPRHAERGPAFAEAAAARGLKVARRSLGEAPAGADVYIADTMGELGLFFRACPLAFVGGSLEPHGGHNPLEPARLGVSIAFGPSMENFVELAGELIGAGAATRVADAAGLSRWVSARLGDPQLVQREGAAARAFAAQGEGTVQRVAEALAPVLAALGPEALGDARA